MLRKICTLLFILLLSCRPDTGSRHKVVYVNSYHPGHPPTDEVSAGVFENLPADSLDLFIFYMDTKRNPSAAYIHRRSTEIMDSIRQIGPDILLVSDDNAVKYLVEPYQHELGIPVVFCGVNWSADQYGLSEELVTGMIEVLPVEQLVQALKAGDPGIESLMVINENTTTSRKTVPYIDALLLPYDMTVKHELVDDFENWKRVFRESNSAYDVIYLQTNGAIRNWDHDEALRFIKEHIRVPVVTCEEFMMAYSVFGMTQVSREQGAWAALTARAILKGTDPVRIPEARNQLSTVWINCELAEIVGFQPDSSLTGRIREYVLP